MLTCASCPCGVCACVRWVHSDSLVSIAVASTTETPRRALKRLPEPAFGASKSGVLGSLRAVSGIHETTCLVLGPRVCRASTDAAAELAAASSSRKNAYSSHQRGRGGGGGDDDSGPTLGEVLDAALRDRFELAGARLVRLSDAQAMAWARMRERAMVARWGAARRSCSTRRAEALAAALVEGPVMVVALHRDNAIARLCRDGFNGDEVRV